MQSPFEDGESAPLATIGPRSVSEQVQSGESLIADVAECANNMVMRAAPHNEAIKKYDRVAAREYAQEWSCNLGISTKHASCHNAPKYEFYDGDKGSDCANFVSQCFHEGGLETDDTWYINSTAWITTGNRGGGLRQWIVNNDLFFHTTNVNKICPPSNIYRTTAISMCTEGLCCKIILVNNSNVTAINPFPTYIF